MRRQLAVPTLAIGLGYAVSALLSWILNSSGIKQAHGDGPWLLADNGGIRSDSSWRPAWTDLREVWEDVNENANHLANVSSTMSPSHIDSLGNVSGFPLPARLPLLAVKYGAHTAQLTKDAHIHPPNARILYVPDLPRARSLNTGYICVAVCSCCHGWAITERLLRSLMEVDDPIHIVLVDDNSKVVGAMVY